MAISQRQFAAEIVDGDGDAVKFDDIGCMLRFLAGTNRKAAAVFVVDYGTRQWTEAKTAYFVRGSKVRTPMAGGILAFSGRAQAEAAVREIGGQVLAYSELSKP